MTRGKLPSKAEICARWRDDLRLNGRPIYEDHCWRCGNVGSVDRSHIVPRSRGGSDDVSNLHLLCRSCHFDLEGVVLPLPWKNEPEMDIYWKEFHAKAPDSQLLTIEEAAHSLNTSVRHVRALTYDRRLAFIKVGHLVRIERSEVFSFIDRQRVAAAAAP